MQSRPCCAFLETMKKARDCVDSGQYLDLGNNVFLDMQKSTRNTAVIKDYSSGLLTDIYLHHSKGHGRVA